MTVAVEAGVRVEDEIAVDYALDTGLVLDGRRERTEHILGPGPVPVFAESRPALTLGTRVFADDDGAVRFCPPLTEPVFERRAGCVVIRRLRREVIVDAAALAWHVMREMNGSRTTEELLGRLPDAERADASALIGCLAQSGVVDVSGRPMARLVHSATKKGVLPGGHLDETAVLALVTDDGYRRYPDAPRISLSKTPLPLGGLEHVLESRRSRRAYRGDAITRREFETLMTAACGVTGSLTWSRRQVQLRAYPSSGGLYSVEIYPVVFRVAHLERGVYHLVSAGPALERLGRDTDAARVIGAALSTERVMLSATAAMVCLTASFTRHERKYGEGGYRMLVAEAGHIAQNLILVATALGLDARPFGGVFDGLVNTALGLGGEDEQFLLSVIVGHADDG